MQRPTLTQDSRVLIIRINHSNAGFFVYLTFTLNQIRYCEEHDMLPVVHFGAWSENGPNAYHDPSIGENLWDYFFKPVAGYTFADIQSLIADPSHPLSEKNLVYLDNEQLSYLHAGKPDSIYNYPYGYYVDQQGNIPQWYGQQRRKAQAIIQQYIHLKSEIRQELEAFVVSHFHPTPVLGVHIRGTDKARETGRLSKILPPHRYFSHIDKYIAKHPSCKVFLATDQRQFAESMKQRYPDRIITYSNILSDSNINAVQLHDGKNYLKGKEVLFDSLLLSKCDYLLKCCSAVSEYAHYFNPDLKSTDLDEYYSKTTLSRQIYQHLLHDPYCYFREVIRNFRNPDKSNTECVFFILTGFPPFRLFFDYLDTQQYSDKSLLRLLYFTRKYISLRRHKEEIPYQQARQFAKHARQRIGADYYSFRTAKGKKYLEIRCDGDPQAAFFAQFCYVLQQIRFAETHDLIPVVNFDHDYNYYRDEHHSDNIWENYFAPVAGVTASRLNKLPSKEITFLRPEQQRTLFLGDGDEPPVNYDAEAKKWWQRQREMGARLTRQYVTVRPDIVKKVEDFYQSHLAGYCVLGIHLRGTDKSVRFDGKPHKGPERFTRIIPPEEYMPVIDQFLSQNPDGKLFVASDQKQFITVLSEQYGARLVHTRAARSSTHKAVFNRSGSGFQRGIEVLTDMLLLSKSNFLLKCMSNVGEVAVYFNPEMPVIDMFYEHNPDDFTDFFTPTDDGNKQISI